MTGKIKEFPTKVELDKLFPDTTVALEKIDGHVYLVNQNAIDKASIKWNTKIAGGEIVKNASGNPGVLIDNPMRLIDSITPPLSLESKIQALKYFLNTCILENDSCLSIYSFTMAYFLNRETISKKQKEYKAG